MRPYCCQPEPIVIGPSKCACAAAPVTLAPAAAADRSDDGGEAAVPDVPAIGAT